ncbi:hypothetical protein EV368DRAFT_89552 [Lentinula lateritia]|nr:hypothetical protein EV368DRAFT_89552 [Lentinula lateritia]
MLDEQDAVSDDQLKLQKLPALQQEEAAIAAKCKHGHSPLAVAGPSCKRIQSEVPKKCSHSSKAVPAPSWTSPSAVEVPARAAPVQGPSGLAHLADIAKVHAGAVQQVGSPPAAQMPIKDAGSNLLSSNPSFFELESRPADSQWENSSLMTALRDMSHALEACQREVEQLQTSNREVLQHKMVYRHVLDQFSALDRALSGSPGQPELPFPEPPEHFRKFEEDL